MKYYHCEWCSVTAPEYNSEGWKTIPSPEGDGLEYTYCPICSQHLKTILGNRPGYVEKLLRISMCTDGLFKAIGDWQSRKGNVSATPAYMFDPDTELSREYSRIRAEYLDMARRLVEDEE